MEVLIMLGMWLAMALGFMLANHLFVRRPGKKAAETKRKHDLNEFGKSVGSDSFNALMWCASCKVAFWNTDRHWMQCSYYDKKLLYVVEPYGDPVRLRRRRRLTQRAKADTLEVKEVA